MLLGYKNTLQRLRIVLASQSPRRQQILRENLGISDFTIVVSGFNEDIPKESCSGPADYVMQTCRSKAIDVIQKLKSSSSSAPDVIIASDTVVVLDQEILEKPGNRDVAREMLLKMSGREHEVLTAVTLATKKKSCSNNDDSYDLHTFYECTKVDFSVLSERTIEGYLDSGESFDKAGGYGIQGLGSSMISGIRGCFFNVMGFPVHKFACEFTKYLDSIEDV